MHTMERAERLTRRELFEDPDPPLVCHKQSLDTSVFREPVSVRPDQQTNTHTHTHARTAYCFKMARALSCWGRSGSTSIRPKEYLISLAEGASQLYALAGLATCRAASVQK